MEDNNEFGPKFVRITCFCYAKNIPIEKNYKTFIRNFYQIFNIKKEIKNIKFRLFFENNKIKPIPFDIENEEDYRTAFTSENSMKMQFSKISGSAQFEGSEIDKNGISDKLIETSSVLDPAYKGINFEQSKRIENIKENINNFKNDDKNNNYIYNHNKDKKKNNYNNNNNINNNYFYNNNNDEKKNNYNNNNINNNYFYNNNNDEKKRNNNNNNNNNNYHINKEDLKNKKVNMRQKEDNISDEKKKEKINALKKEILELNKIYENEKLKNENFKRKYKNNIGQNQKNNIPKYEKENNYNQKNKKIPYEILAKKNFNKESLIKSVFIDEMKNENKIVKKIYEIDERKPIQYTFKVLKIDSNEYWPPDTLLYCIPEDTEIYFPHVKLTDKNVKKMKIKDKICYEITVNIKFKNYKHIHCKEYILNAKLISDSFKNISKNVGKVILKVEKNSEFF